MLSLCVVHCLLGRCIPAAVAIAAASAIAAAVAIAVAAAASPATSAPAGPLSGFGSG